MTRAISLLLLPRTLADIADQPLPHRPDPDAAVEPQHGTGLEQRLQPLGMDLALPQLLEPDGADAGGLLFSGEHRQGWRRQDRRRERG